MASNTKRLTLSRTPRQRVERQPGIVNNGDFAISAFHARYGNADLTVRHRFYYYVVRLPSVAGMFAKNASGLVNQVSCGIGR